MSRRTKAKAKEPDPDFKIYVDPSCLSAPMDEETKPTPQVTDDERGEAQIKCEAEDGHKQEIEDEASPETEVHNESESIAHDVEADYEDSEVLDEADESLVDAEVEPETNHAELGDEHSLLSSTRDGEDEKDQSVDGSILEDSVAEESFEDSEIVEDTVALDEEGDEAEESIVSDLHTDPIEEHLSLAEDTALEETANASESGESAHDETEADEISHLEDAEPHAEEPEEDDESAPKPTQRADDEESFVDQDESPRRESGSSDRRTSLRTEALIQAAARAVMAKLENRDDKNNPDEEAQDHEGDISLLSNTNHDEVDSESTEVTNDADASANVSRRESAESTVHHTHPAPLSVSGDDGGDSSSHHEPDDDDVFSDNHSARSSLSGSLGGGPSADEPLKSPALDTKQRDGFIRSPRLSTISMISGLSQYEKDEAEFVPTTRESPRAPYRTSSSLRAQMSSPTPSVFAGATPRSHHKKRSQGGSVSFPTVSRLGSPNVSAQYSPKGRTPTRFKPRQEAPLVLLHVTLLPLRWMWDDVVDNLDAMTGKDRKDSQKESGSATVGKFEPSVELRSLRDAWRQLQDRVGDTVLERGILLPHPQNDFEILEERLLEALELPLRRRARILECGHYIGPTNLNADDELSQDESEDEYRPQSRFSTSQREKRHWCGTCKGEIKLEDLGPGRIFRVKVYASNGLMKAGAWDACWKEMERVDVEVEPIVEPTIQSELERLAVLQDEMAESRHVEDEEDHHGAYDDEQDLLPPGVNTDTTLVESRDYHVPASSPPGLNTHLAMHASPLLPPPTSALRLNNSYDSPASSTGLPSPTRSAAAMAFDSADQSEARRLRDEERMREIYGEDDPYSTPQLPVPSHHSHIISPSSSMHAEPTTNAPRHPDSYIPPPMPRSPSEEAYERREAREQVKDPYQSASLPQLLLEVVKVLMRDPKNVAIAFLGVLAMFFMLRTPPVQPSAQGLGHYDPGAEAVVMAKAPIEAMPASVATESSIVPSSSSTTESVVVASSPAPAPVKEKERKVVRVVETVTETLRGEATVETIYETETIKVTVSAPASASASDSAPASVSASSSAKPSTFVDPCLERKEEVLGDSEEVPGDSEEVPGDSEEALSDPEEVPTHDEI